MKTGEIMNFHYQNLNTDNKKRFWVHGRCWWNHGKFLQAEWSIPARRGVAFEIHLNHYGDTALGLRLSIPFLFSLHLGTENRRLYKFLEPITRRKDQTYTNGRIIGFYISDWNLHISLWDDPMEHRSKDPKWWSYHKDLIDLVFGRPKHTKEVLQSGDAEIDMPEGAYPAKYEVEKRTWKRPRWFATTQTSITFDIPAGIPHEGKGENSWDCGMDATHGISTYWNQNIYEAAKRIALRCLETRSRYGSLSSTAYAEWRAERFAALLAAKGGAE